MGSIAARSLGSYIGFIAVIVLAGERARGTVQMLVARNGDLRFEAEVSLQGVVAALAVHIEEAEQALKAAVAKDPKLAATTGGSWAKLEQAMKLQQGFLKE